MHCILKASLRRASRSEPFLADFVQRMHKNSYLLTSGQNSDNAVGLGDLNSYMVRTFWQSVDIYHVTLTFDPLTLNMLRRLEIEII